MPRKSLLSSEAAPLCPFPDELSRSTVSSSRTPSSLASGLSTPTRPTLVDVHLLLMLQDNVVLALTLPTPPGLLHSDGKFQNKKTAIDWNEDVMVPDDEDDDDAKSQAGAPVKLEKKYGAKTVATVNNLDERLIPYDLVRGDVTVSASLSCG